MSFRIKDGLTQGTRKIIDASKNFTGTSYNVRSQYSTLNPTLNLDFTKGVLDPRITFTRNSIGTYVGTDGYIKTASANTPRFDYDPITSQAKGLLIEESRTNLLPNSSDITTWTSVGSLTEVVGATSPDGTGNAIAIADIDTESTAAKQNTLTITDDNSTYCFSVYCKAGTTNVCTLHSAVTGGTPKLGTGTFDFGTNTLTYTGDVTSGGYQQLSNGWYRIWVFLTNNSTGNTIFEAKIISTANSSVSDLGSVIVWGPQVEIGAFQTSYIPTSGTVVTRSADLAVITNLSWYNQSEGTLLASWYDGIDALSGIVSLNDGTPANKIDIRRQSATSVRSYITKNNSSITFYGVNNTQSPNVKHTAAIAYKLNTGAFYVDGNSDINTNAPSDVTIAITQLQLGGIDGDAFYLTNSCISSIKYYSKRLSNTELQNLTKG